jgi:hypothetical protein
MIIQRRTNFFIITIISIQTGFIRREMVVNYETEMQDIPSICVGPPVRLGGPLVDDDENSSKS